MGYPTVGTTPPSTEQPIDVLETATADLVRNDLFFLICVMVFYILAKMSYMKYATPPRVVWIPLFLVWIPLLIVLG